MIGLVLVAVYFGMAIYTAGKALEKSVGLAQGLVVGGFWLRLMILGVILYLISLVKGINLIAVILTFAIGYSIILPISLGVWLPTKRGKSAGKEKRTRR